MQTILHVGPHKTATTSLQYALLQQFGDDAVRPVWYPKPPRAGPGHAVLAWSCLKLRGIGKGPNLALELQERAREGGCHTLVISSEEFCRGYGDGVASIRKAFPGPDVHLLFTLSPIKRRVLSAWQETLKHRSVRSLAEFLGSISRRAEAMPPGLQPDLIERFCAAFQGCRTSVIVTSRSDERVRVFERFTAATGIPLQNLDTGKLQLNRSMGGVEAEVVFGLNHGLKEAGLKLDAASYARLRGHLGGLFAAKEWREFVPYQPTQLPERWAPAIDQLAAETLESLRRLQAKGTIAVYGELSSLGSLEAEPAPVS